MKDVMLDLETLGTVPGFTIMSIGAVEFGPEGLGREFYCVISRLSCAEYGLKPDPDTVMWWNDQSEEARQILAEVLLPTALKLPVALHRLNQWMPWGAQVWGNGPAFDNAGLAVAYHKAGLKPSWKHYDECCFRTIKRMVPKERAQPVRQGVYHHALDDAKHQARWAIALHRDHGVRVFV